MKKIIVAIVFILMIKNIEAQSKAKAKAWVDTLTSATFWGRGYTNNGMQLAANYIESEFKRIGLFCFGKKGYQQEFNYTVNTFPGKMDVTINGKKLIPGVDFIVGAESIGLKSNGTLEQTDSVSFINKKQKFIIQKKDKLTMEVANVFANYTLVELDKKSFSEIPLNFEVDIETKFLKKFKANNIVGYIKGSVKPDSFLVITAHYDHLGGLGSNTYFPGANDNASGISFLLGLAEYFQKNIPKYSIAFICFAGEEAGLLGSKYFTEKPLVDLKKIKFLLNTDLAGTGEDGITVVNGTEFKKEFDVLQSINNKNNYLKAVNIRGKAANSDHYFFTEKGVPSFFFYTLGGIAAYHDVFDKAATLPMTKYEDLQKLMIDFIKTF
jgi:aminopeptidase YwaD